MALGHSEAIWGRKLLPMVQQNQIAIANTIAQFRGFSAEMRERVGVASGVEFRVRSFPWILAGHERHHRGVLERRYFPAL